MKAHILNNDKQLSRFFKSYINAILFIIEKVTYFFHIFKLPGLSRVLWLFSFLPTKGSFKLIKFSDHGEFIFPVFDYYYNMFFYRGRDYEIELINLCKNINEEFVLFDGGANLGYISSSFIHLSNNCTSLIAIEPNTKLLDNLKLNIDKAILSSKKEKFEYKILSNAISDVTKANNFFKI